MLQQYNVIIEREKQDKEDRTIRLRKDVIVVKGRKVEKGTIGRVIWMGSTKYGECLRIETLIGEKIFISKNNVITLVEYNKNISEI